MTPIEKTIVVAVTTATAAGVSMTFWDWFTVWHGVICGIGLLGGYLSRIGASRKERKTWTEIVDEIVVMALTFLGSVIVCIGIGYQSLASDIGMLFIGFAVAFRGDLAFDLVVNYIFTPIMSAIQNGKKDDNDESSV